jgi:hypothetical protein
MCNSFHTGPREPPVWSQYFCEHCENEDAALPPWICRFAEAFRFLDLPECVGSLRFQFVPVFISAREDSSTMPEDRSMASSAFLSHCSDDH